MFCYNCGNQLSDDARTCDKCGIPMEIFAKVKKEQEAVAESEETVVSVEPEASAAPTAPAAPTQVSAAPAAPTQVSAAPAAPAQAPAAPTFVQSAAPVYQAPPSYMPRQTYAPVPPKEESKWMGVVAMVCGIVGLVFSSIPFLPLVPEILAITFGIVGIIKKNGKGMAIAGLVLGGVALLTTVFTSFVWGIIILDEILGELFYDYYLY